MSNTTCKHETAIVSKSFKQLKLTQLICTWRCKKDFWMKETNGISKEISAEEAIGMIENT